jgi:VanZ family protein
MIFIFSNSLDSATESTEKSDAVHQAVNEVAQELGAKKEISKDFVRQSAHFLEFTALGMASTLTVLFAIAPDPRRALNAKLAFSAIAVPFGALIALIDEYIQLFSDGRAFDPIDILTDSAGAAVGSILTILCYLIVYLIFTLRGKSLSVK